MFLEITEADENHATGTCGPLLIMVWGRETTLPAVAHAKAVGQRLAARHPTGVTFLMIVESTAEIPSSPVRAALSEALRSFGSFVLRSALVHEGTGFRAAAVRGVVTGLSLVARQPYPHQVFDRVEPAVRWLAQSFPAGAEVGAVLDAVAKLRAELELQRSGPRG